MSRATSAYPEMLMSCTGLKDLYIATEVLRKQ
jgi:hypothetical protein